MKASERRARQILGAALEKAHNSNVRAKRAAAAEKLVADFEELAKSEGLKAGQLQDHPEIKFVSVSDGRIVHILLDGDGGIYMRRQTFSRGASHEQAALVYDNVEDSLVGPEVDTSIVPTPGELFPRVHGLAVLATLAAKLFDQKQDH